MLSLPRFLTLTGLTAALCTAVTFALPHDAYIRHQAFSGTIFDRLAWIYERAVFDDTPMDVVIIGSSRSARGANAAALEATLDGVHVANLSMPASGLDVRLAKFATLLEAGKAPKLLVLGVVEALPRFGHQAFGDLATTQQLVSAPPLINATLPANLAGLPYRQLELALASRLPEAFGHQRNFDQAAYRGPTPDHRRFNNPDWSAEQEAAFTTRAAHAATLDQETVRRQAEITPPLLPGLVSGLEFGVSRSYLRRIASMAETAGTEIVFLHLPFYRGYPAPIDRAWLERLGDVWTPPIDREDPENYVDAAHLSQKGIDALTPWLAAKIQETLEIPQ